MNRDTWIWDGEKNRTNRIKHGIGFEMASLVFADPMHLSVPDSCAWELRWQTYGIIQQMLIAVVHTEPAFDPKADSNVGRIISARKATKAERRAFEEA